MVFRISEEITSACDVTPADLVAPDSWSRSCATSEPLVLNGLPSALIAARVLDRWPSSARRNETVYCRRPSDRGPSEVLQGRSIRNLQAVSSGTGYEDVPGRTEGRKAVHG